VESFASNSQPESSKGKQKLDSRNLVPDVEKVRKSLFHIYSLTADKKLLKLLKDTENESLALDDASNRLMAIFRDHNLVEAYSLLYDLNHKQFLLIIFNKIKYYCHLLDPKDILQDVFLSIYRYPHKFKADKPHSFRNWSFSIIRNTILKHLKVRNNQESSSEAILEIVEDTKTDGPLNSLVKKESLNKFKDLYCLYLALYLNIVNNYLSEREKIALHLVEVEDKRYREAAKVLDIKLENFKMVVCRARKKIVKRMTKMLGEDGP